MIPMIHWIVSIWSSSNDQSGLYISGVAAMMDNAHGLSGVQLSSPQRAKQSCEGSDLFMICEPGIFASPRNVPGNANIAILSPIIAVILPVPTIRNIAC